MEDTIMTVTFDDVKKTAKAPTNQSENHGANPTRSDKSDKKNEEQAGPSCSYDNPKLNK